MQACEVLSLVGEKEEGRVRNNEGEGEDDKYEYDDKTDEQMTREETCRKERDMEDMIEKGKYIDGSD